MHGNLYIFPLLWQSPSTDVPIAQCPTTENLVLHFIANNYATFSKRPVFSLLTRDNLAFVKKYRSKLLAADPNTIEIHKAQEGVRQVDSEDKDKSCTVM